MRIPFLSIFMISPFDGLQEHAEKLQECALIFQQAMECHLSSQCKTFEEFRQEIIKLESEADVIKRNIRAHLPKGTVMAVDKFQLFRYLKEQDKVLDTVEDILDWISFKSDSLIPDDLLKDFFLLIDSTVEPIEELSKMVAEARKYFKNFSYKQRNVVKNLIRSLREKEHKVDQLEKPLKSKIFALKIDPVDIFFMIRLVEAIGSIADHAENAGDMMRAMIAR
ncbi:TIGR00153 family protein [Candidatus Magnetomoraceae bacterium gMMP-15]